MILLRILAFLAGFAVINLTIASAVRTFVLPRAAPDFLTRFVFRTARRGFNLVVAPIESYERRDSIMALYAPICLMLLTPIWLTLIAIGYTGLFWGLNNGPLYDAWAKSASSLLTLGFAAPVNFIESVLVFLEAATGMIMVALLIAYLPTIYSVFERREARVAAMAVRLGEPPSAITLLLRAHAIVNLQNLHELWVTFESWFEDLEESHTSLSATVFFRSPNPNHSWITTAGCMMDAAALSRSTLDIPPDPAADLMIRAGYLALRAIAKTYGFQIPDDPQFPAQPISITRAEFDAAYDQLAAAKLPLKPNREQCWQDFAGWRVNYDATLLDICDLVMAPEAQWSADRSQGRWPLTPRFKTRNRLMTKEELYRERKEAELPNIK
jgi:prepilin signal peptidase PulO-like enzyme (type II secretory pathway)